MRAIVAENLHRIYLQKGRMDRSLYEAATICYLFRELKNMGPTNFYEYKIYIIQNLSMHLFFACWVTLHAFLSSVDFLSKSIFFKQFF